MDRRNLHSTWQRPLGFIAVVAAMLSLACTDPRAEQRAGATGAQAAVGGQMAKADIELGDLFIRPKVLKVSSGGTLELTVTNKGALPHDLKLGTEGTRLLNKGEREVASFGPITQNVQLICSVPGHKEAGMVLDVEVAGTPPAAPQSAPVQTHPSGQNARVDPQATPPPNWKRFEPLLAPAPVSDGQVRRITLEATETVLSVAPGVTQEMWTYNDQVPGPILRGRIGDIFEITLVNKGKLGHSIDFHASKVAWNNEMRTIQPGESLLYRFEAKHSGIFMYHCGTAPALHHIGNGMWGAIIIDPPDLPRVDKEFVLVQSEFYLGPEGKPGDLAKMQRDEWDIVTFNGYHNQYAHSPIKIQPNERVRAWVINVGPSENSSFHVVGTIFDTVYKEGAYTLRPNDAQGGAQALDLQPAQGGFVEFSMDAPGLYPIVTHKFSNVGKGALGLFQAGEVAGAGGPAH